jgi:RHS repeat-associated protein
MFPKGPTQSGSEKFAGNLNPNKRREPQAESGTQKSLQGGQPGAVDPSPSNLLPSISMPKGGGAIRDIGEKFEVNAATGTGSMTIPIPFSPCRGTAQLDLKLSYSSGRGNSPFGLGWDMSQPSISRKTDKGLPQYRDGRGDSESDVFMLAGEDLAPVFKRDAQGAVVLDATGWPVIVDETRDGFRIRPYRPRIESQFLRIERWTKMDDPGQIHWRTTTKENVTSVYGNDDNSRVYDPISNVKRIFQWLIGEMYDCEGNAIIYVYKPEDSVNVPPCAHEQNRNPQVRSANRYLKSIKYGNRIPNRHQTTWAPTSAFNLPDTTWMFSVVLDYGEHDVNNPTSAEVAPWLYRQDPFSSFKSGFEIRSYRLCRRLFMFHHFPELALADYLVKSMNLTYDENPFFSFLTQVNQVGYVFDQTQNQYLSKSFPPVEFSYSGFPSDDKLSRLPVQDIDAESLENLPRGVDGSTFQWVDLDGEGLSGVFVEQDTAWFYKQNLSARSLDYSDKGIIPRFGPAEPANSKPGAIFANSNFRFLSLAGDGHLDVVNAGQGCWGFYERTSKNGWDSYRQFKSFPNVDTKNPELKFVDITGDGLTDILVGDDEAFTWYASLGHDGYGEGVRVPKASDEEKGARLIFEDPEQSIYLADMSGDGLTDVVRVRNGDISYWPNMGYGQFGAKVRMDNAPWFDRVDQFNQKQVRIADVDGSGTSDILYVSSDGVDIYLNQSGNGFSERKRLTGFSSINNLSTVSTVDLMGTGTTCLVWCSPLPGNARMPMKYVDLTQGVKPNLLIKIVNNLGAESRIHYMPSTAFYQADKLAGKPWITRLPFPVHCVHKLESFDHLSRNHFVSRYAYHDGYFDGYEREFRGFAMVEQWDTEDFDTMSNSSISLAAAAANVNSAVHVSPKYTKTWLHTGVYIDNDKISQYLAHQYFGAPPVTDAPKFASFLTTLLDDTVLPPGLPSDSYREACRSLKGKVLRTEVYAKDKSPKSTIPYSVVESNYTIEVLQSEPDSHSHSTFTVHPRETITYQFERNLNDPRVLHNLTIQVDAYGNVLKEAKVAYGRATWKSPLSGDEQTTQEESLITYDETDVSNVIIDSDNYLLPKQSEARSYQLYGFKIQGGVSRFQWDDFAKDDFAPMLNLPEIPYETTGTEQIKQRRLIARNRVLYRSDDLSRLLPVGQLESMGLLGESYKLALTPGLVLSTYGRTKSDGSTEILIPNPIQIFGGKGGDQGGYVDLDSNGNWWIPSGRSYFHPDPASTLQQELTNARSHFLRTRRHVDAFGRTILVDYDNYDLLLARTVDAVANVVQARNDYRVLQPDLITDPNGNRSQCSFDEFGKVVGTAVMGKVAENLGDSLDQFRPLISPNEVDEFFINPKGPIAATLLGNATTRIIYNISRYWLELNVTKKLPTYTATLSREMHVTDSSTAPLKIQICFTYCDGNGREIQSKLQAEPGKIVDGGQAVIPRWVGSGWKIFNNKGKPVKEFEPFFDDTHEYKSDQKVGVSSILCYDPVDRVVATVHPNHAWSKSVFEPWQTATYDENDTILLDPKIDADVGGLFRLLPESDYLPTWFNARNTGQKGPEEQAAAVKASMHANTPTILQLDPLNRTFLTTVDNGPGGKYTTRTIFDIQGNQIQTMDAIGRVAERCTYDMLGNRIYSSGMESGERWTVFNVSKNYIYKWDGRNQRFRLAYDAAQRPTEMSLQQNQQLEVMVEKTVYGEAPQDGAVQNQRGRVFQTYDQAGIETHVKFDFKGNLVLSQRQFAQEYKSIVSWSGTVLLQDPLYLTQTRYDALDRDFQRVTPDNTVVRHQYNETGLLEQVDVNLRGELLNGQPTWTPFISNIDYNPKGQRTLIQYGNNVSTTFAYDPDTFRLVRQQTWRVGVALQDLQYYYDLIGNVTSVRDNAQQTVFFRNQRVEPSNDYTYDPIYRLIKASGREHLGQINGPNPPAPIDTFHTNLEQPGDGKALGTYVETYTYDSVGNILSVQHRGSDPIHPGWTRTYSYNEMSQTESSKVSNRLSSTTVAGSTAVYGYDAHGNMTMPHLSLMEWDCKDQLHATAAQNVNPGSTPETTWYVYNSDHKRVRKVTERYSPNGEIPTRLKERLYLNDFEVYRVYDVDGITVNLERVTLNVMENQQCIALVETRTLGDEPDIPQRLNRYQFSNNIDSVCLELDDQAQIISYEEYTPYGSTSYQAVRSKTEAPKRYRYTRKEQDDESGLYYYGMRYYAGWLGRWTSCDPEGFVDGIDLYVYVKSNPTNRNDPKGTQGTPANQTTGSDPKATEPTPEPTPEPSQLPIVPPFEPLVTPTVPLRAADKSAPPEVFNHLLYPDPSKLSLSWKPITGAAVNVPLNGPFVFQAEGSVNFNENGYQGLNLTLRLTTETQIDVKGSVFEQETTGAKLVDQFGKTSGGKPLFGPEALLQSVSDRYDTVKTDQHAPWSVDLGVSYNNQVPDPKQLGVVGDTNRYTAQPDFPGFTFMLSLNIPEFFPKLLQQSLLKF